MEKRNCPSGWLISWSSVRRSDSELAKLQSGSKTAMKSVLYGITLGANFSDMYPLGGTATNFLHAVRAMFVVVVVVWLPFGLFV